MARKFADAPIIPGSHLALAHDAGVEQLLLDADPGDEMPEDGPFTIWVDQSSAEFEVLNATGRTGALIELDEPTAKPHRRRAPVSCRPGAVDYEAFAAGGGGGSLDADTPLVIDDGTVSIDEGDFNEFGILGKVAAHDSFGEKATGAPATADSGQVYHNTGTAPMTVQTSGTRKVLTHSLATGDGAGYAQLELDAPCRWAFAKVRFKTGSTAGSVVAIATADVSLASGHVPQMAPHAVFGPAGDWQATVWEGTPDATVDFTGDSGNLFGVSDRGFAPYDGTTEVWIGFAVDTDGYCRLLLPNGDVVRTRDARYLSLAGNYVFIEIQATSAATDAKPEILDWMAGTTAEEMARFFDQRGFTYEVMRQMLRPYVTGGEVAAYAAPLSHTHPQADVTDLVSALAAKAALTNPSFSGGITLPNTTGTSANLRVGSSQSGFFGSHSTTPKRLGFKLGNVVILDAEIYSIGAGAAKFQAIPLRAEAGFSSGMQEAFDGGFVYVSEGGKVVVDNLSGAVSLTMGDDISDPTYFSQLAGAEITIADLHGAAGGNPITVDLVFPLPTGEDTAVINAAGGYFRLVVADSQWLLAGHNGVVFT